MKQNRDEEILERIEELEKAVFGSNEVPGIKNSKERSKINFSLNARAFIKRNGEDKNPSEKFVLITAFLAQGRVGVEVKVKEVAKLWNTMTSKDLLGCKFNTKYPVDSKNEGWVNSPKRGVFTLTDEWKNVL